MIGPVELAEIEALYPLSPSVGRLATLVCDESVDFGEVVRVIELDQAFTANVLRLANSAWSASRTPIGTVKDAVGRLGSDRILQLVVGNRLAGLMQQPCDGYELAERELWRHSVASALAAELLAGRASVSVPRLAFTAALVHDIGKLVLSRHLTSELVDEVRALMLTEDRCYLDAEREVLGIDHSEVGGAVAEHWRFPEELIRAIENHHEPDVLATPVLDVIHIANFVAKAIGVGLGVEQMHLRMSASAPKRLGLSEECLDAVCADAVVELETAEQMYGLAPKTQAPAES